MCFLQVIKPPTPGSNNFITFDIGFYVPVAVIFCYFNLVFVNNDRTQGFRSGGFTFTDRVNRSIIGSPGSIFNRSFPYTKDSFFVRSFLGNRKFLYWQLEPRFSLPVPLPIKKIIKWFNGKLFTSKGFYLMENRLTGKFGSLRVANASSIFRGC